MHRDIVVESQPLADSFERVFSLLWSVPRRSGDFGLLTHQVMGSGRIFETGSPT